MGMILFSAMPSLFEDIFPTDDQEWQVHMIVSLPYVTRLQICDNSTYRKDLQKCFTAFCFLSRLYYYPDAVLEVVERMVDLETLHQTFYRCYQEQCCTSRNKVMGKHAGNGLCNIINEISILAIAGCSC